MARIARIEPRGDTFVVALIAHDGKKHEMLELVREYRGLLSRLPLVATGTTGRLVAEELGVHVDRVASGPYGGDLQLASRIVEGEIDLVVFFRDPQVAHPHGADVQALLKVCDISGVPVATNTAGARILLSYLWMQLEEREAERAIAS